MFLSTYPLFKPGRILKIEMLEALRDFPKDIVDISLEKYSNGILRGCDIEINKDYIIVTRGILKYQDVIYILKEDYTIPYESNKNTQVLKIRFLGESLNRDFLKYDTEIYLDDNLEINRDEMELCRFKLKTGARLRNDYISFKDMSTEYDTVNIINCPFCANGISSLSPKIFKNFGKEVFKYKASNPLDISFAMTCLQSNKPIEIDLVKSYIEARLKMSLKEISNDYIYDKLFSILEELKDGSGYLGKENRLRHRTILVD